MVTYGYEVHGICPIEISGLSEALDDVIASMPTCPKPENSTMTGYVDRHARIALSQTLEIIPSALPSFVAKKNWVSIGFDWYDVPMLAENLDEIMHGQCKDWRPLVAQMSWTHGLQFIIVREVPATQVNRLVLPSRVEFYRIAPEWHSGGIYSIEVLLRTGHKRHKEVEYSEMRVDGNRKVKATLRLGDGSQKEMQLLPKRVAKVREMTVQIPMTTEIVKAAP